MSHILIVEDDEMLGEMVELILDRAGMTHARARTGAMALELLPHVPATSYSYPAGQPFGPGTTFIRSGLRAYSSSGAPSPSLTASR